MKKVLSVMMVLVLSTVCLAGCGTSEKQDAILKYNNTDIVGLKTEQDACEKATNDLGEVAEDDIDGLYTQLKDNLVPAYEALLTKVKAITTTDDEVKALNDTYVKAFETTVDAYKTYMTSLENGEDGSAECATKLDEASKLVTEWKTALTKLCEDNDIQDQE